MNAPLLNIKFTIKLNLSYSFKKSNVTDSLESILSCWQLMTKIWLWRSDPKFYILGFPCVLSHWLKKMWGFGPIDKASCSTTQYRPSSSKNNSFLWIRSLLAWLEEPHVMSALTSVQLSMAQYVAVFKCETKYRFDKQTPHPFTTWHVENCLPCCPHEDCQLRILASYEAKIAKICNFWTFSPVIQLINHLLKIWQKAFLPNVP